MLWKSSFLLAACLTGLVTSSGRQEAPRHFKVDGYTPEMIAAAVLTEKRCSTCHSIKRTLTAPHRGQRWAAVVEDMRDREKSGITRAEAKRITEFLAFHTRRESPKGKTKAVRGFALVAKQTLGPAAELPADVNLGRTEAYLDGVEAEAVGEGVRIVAAVDLIEREVTLEAVVAPDGTLSDETEEVLRQWRVGPYAFRLVISIHAVSLADPARPTVTLATYVVRERT